jgi:hypothetical protein
MAAEKEPLDDVQLKEACLRVLSRVGQAALTLTGRQLREMVAKDIGSSEDALEMRRNVFDEAFLEFVQPYLDVPDDLATEAPAQATAKVHKDRKSEPKKKKGTEFISKENSSKKRTRTRLEDKPKASKKENSNTQKTSKSASDDPLARLKRYVHLCGVRRVWKRELDGMSEKEARRHIENLLISLGVEGRPSIEKCNAVKKKREFQEELSVLDIGNVVSSRLRSREPVKRARAIIDSENDSDVEAYSSDDSTDEQKTARFDLSGYGDAEE